MADLSNEMSSLTYSSKAWFLYIDVRLAASCGLMISGNKVTPMPISPEGQSVRSAGRPRMFGSG